MVEICGGSESLVPRYNIVSSLIKDTGEGGKKRWFKSEDPLFCVFRLLPLLPSYLSPFFRRFRRKFCRTSIGSSVSAKIRFNVTLKTSNIH